MRVSSSVRSATWRSSVSFSSWSRRPVRRPVATSAATASIRTTLTPTNACSRSSDSFGVARAKGPSPLSVPTTATTASDAAAVAVSRAPKRNAAQSSTGLATKCSG